MQHSNTAGCILLKFYIKPQQLVFTDGDDPVVSYRNSTSNHNIAFNDRLGRRVVSYRNSTSNHNSAPRRKGEIRLYLIEILHQTTTGLVSMKKDLGCILSKFYIKPQRSFPRFQLIPGCILSKFYIKPQLNVVQVYQMAVVSYRNSTSNHNFCLCRHTR